MKKSACFFDVVSVVLTVLLRQKAVVCPELLAQFRLSVQFYAELLFRWQLLQKRVELLKAIAIREGPSRESDSHRIGMTVCFLLNSS